MSLISTLPASSFVAFSARKARTPTEVWSNPYGFEGLNLNDHAYFIPLPGDPARCCYSKTKTFFAERYGGQGLGANGGGVRCGLAGAIQIKGLGKSPLAGDLTDFFHSYGGATLNEAVLEALWGEVCHLALPFGGVRCYGLIGTGTRVPIRYPKVGQDKTTPRALVVREAVLRPAHYMRAIFFSPKGQMKHAPSDAIRTRAAVEVIAKGFQMSFGKSIATCGGDVSFWQEAVCARAGILEMCRRFAKQVAAARAKRIMHGSLTASNIAVDGRWLDYGSISAVSDYGRIIIPRGAPDFMHEEDMFKSSIGDLVFFLKKYLPNSQGAMPIARDEIWTALQCALNVNEQVEFLKLLGIPQERLEKIDNATKQRAFMSIREIIARGNKSPPHDLISR